MDSCHSILTGPIRCAVFFLLPCSNNNIQSRYSCKTQIFPQFRDRKERKSVTGLVMSTLPPCDFDTLWYYNHNHHTLKDKVCEPDMRYKKQYVKHFGPI